jgi:hypothetical protein
VEYAYNKINMERAKVGLYTNKKKCNIDIIGIIYHVIRSDPESELEEPYIFVDRLEKWDMHIFKLII